MPGGRKPLGDRAMTKAERDAKSRARRLGQWQAMTDALAAIADPLAIRTLREARARAQGVLDDIAGTGIPSADPR